MDDHRPSTTELHRIVSHKGRREVVDTLVADGWEFLRLSGKNHPIMVWPKAREVAEATGSRVQDRITLPLTPSDNRAILNSLTDARRVSGVDHRKSFRSRRGKGKGKH